jgi:hypothetical protein
LQEHADVSDTEVPSHESGVNYDHLTPVLTPVFVMIDARHNEILDPEQPVVWRRQTPIRKHKESCHQDMEDLIHDV